MCDCNCGGPSIQVRVDNAHVTLSPGIVTEQSVAIVKDMGSRVARKVHFPKIAKYRG